MPTRSGLPLCLAGIELSRKMNRPSGPPIGPPNHPRTPRHFSRHVEDSVAAAETEAEEASQTQPLYRHMYVVESHSSTSLRGGRPITAVQCQQGLQGPTLEQHEIGVVGPRGRCVLTRKNVSSKVDESRRGRNGGCTDMGIQTGCGTESTATVMIQGRRGEPMGAVLGPEETELDFGDEGVSDDGEGQDAKEGDEEEDEEVEAGDDKDDDEEADVRLQHQQSLNNEMAYWDSLRAHLQQHSHPHTHPQPGPLNWPSPPSSPTDHSGRALDIIRAAMTNNAVDGVEEWKAWGAKAA